MAAFERTIYSHFWPVLSQSRIFVVPLPFRGKALLEVLGSFESEVPVLGNFGF